MNLHHKPIAIPAELTRNAFGDPSDHAQKLRRQIARGANLLVIQPGPLQKRFILKRLNALGVCITVIDSPDSPWPAQLSNGLFHNFVPLNFSDQLTAQDVLHALSHHLPDVIFNGVTTFYEDSVLLTADVAAALNLPGHLPSSVIAARNKFLTRQTLHHAGIPTPRFRSIVDQADIAPACEFVGFPAVLKPAFGTASLHVVQINSLQEALEAFCNARRQMCAELDPLWFQGTVMVLEQMLTGPEVDVDIVLCNGHPVFSSVTDNWAMRPPFFLEVGASTPSVLSSVEQMKLTKFSAQCVLALQFRDGVFHVECRNTPAGPQLIEVNARMGGGPIREIVNLVWGVDLVEEQCFLALGIPSNPVTFKVPHNYAAAYVFQSPASGTFNDAKWLDAMRANPSVYSVEGMKELGTKAAGAQDGMTDPLACAVFTSRDGLKDLYSSVKQFVRNTASPVKPVCDVKFFIAEEQFPFSLIL